MLDSKFIASVIKKNRIKLGFSQTELSRKMGVSGPAICELEKGVRLPSLNMAVKLSIAFNLHLERLVGLPESRPIKHSEKLNNFYCKYRGIDAMSPKNLKVIKLLIESLSSPDYGGL